MRTVLATDADGGDAFVNSLPMSIMSEGQRFRAHPGLESLFYGGGLLFAIVTALFTGEDPVRAWAPFAVFGSGLGVALLVLSRFVPVLDGFRCKRPWAVPAAVASLVTLAPLAYETLRGIAVIEVGILEDGAARWLETGSPYPDAQELEDATEAADYNVYFPLLVLSGLPTAVFGESVFTDARWYLLSGALLALCAATRSPRTLLLFCALPPVGMVATAGMTDLLPICLACAALVLLARGEPVRAGVTAGLASGAKLLAWPLVPVLFVAFLVRRTASTACRYCLAVASCLAFSLLPALVDLEAFWRNTFALPLALEPVTLVARTPLPGYLLSASGEAGRMMALMLLVGAALGMLIWLSVRPPRGLFAAATRLAVGWTLLFSLAPATRIGYFVFPLAVLAWALLWREPDGDQDPVVEKANAAFPERSAR